MRRKNRKWVAIAAGLYLFLMWSAWHWAVSQRVPEGNLFVRIEAEGKRRLAEERVREAEAQPAPQPTGESHLTAAGPAYIAARYDESHVVFIVTTDTESRFSASPLMRSGTPTKVSAPARPAAPLAGLQELWEPDSQSLHFFPKIIQTTRPGDQWILSAAPGLAIPVTIDRTIIAPTGCSLALGFLASIPSDQQKAIAASNAEYFAVRRTPVEPADPAVNSNISHLRDWKPGPAAMEQIEQQLNDRMKQDVSAIDARLRANAGSPGARAGEFPVANPQPRTKEWLRADRGLLQGEGHLDFDIHAFQLTPDSKPRLFVRARWTLATANVFLMAAWFKTESMNVNSHPALLFVDSRWSKALREGEAAGSLGDRLDFQTVLNEFDADHDGWAELLIHSYEGTASTLSLNLYTDHGLVPLKTPLTRDTQSPEACLDP